MARVTIEAWKCDVCGWTWIPESASDPARCPSRKCRSSHWNSGKVESPKAEKMIIARDSEKPREKPKAEPAKPIELEIPKVITDRAELAAGRYEKPAHAANCKCFSCKPRK